MRPEEILPELRERNAYNYVRQSSYRQVLEHTESARRQHDFQDRAVGLGWTRDRVITIDEDQGKSGSVPSTRSGFERLVTEVSLGRVGLVMALEASRLARNSMDWARLIQYCAITGTPILDETGLYNPADPADSIALGIKAFTSETERQMIRSRMRGGVISKAKRGEFHSRLPVGFVYQDDGKVILDPDRHVQDAVRHLFRTFQRTGTALGVVREYQRAGLTIPRRLAVGERKGEVTWVPLAHSWVIGMLHNPRYAGTYCYGMKQHLRLPDGRAISRHRPMEKWVALIRNAHPGYITWEEFENNVKRLQDNSLMRGPKGKCSPPREGPALLQGIAICGKCGHRMTVRYGWKVGHETVFYECNANILRTGDRPCQYILGNGIDDTVGELLLKSITPLALDVSLQVQQEVEDRYSEADRLRRQEVERKRYEADSARRRYLAVDPANRLVADTLEAEWNERLRSWREAQESYQREVESGRQKLTEERKAQVRALASDFPRVWKDPRTPIQEKKRMLRVLLEDVTLMKTESTIIANVRFRGGATQKVEVVRPLPAPKKLRMPEDVVKAIDQLLDDHTPAAIAQMLNERGERPVRIKVFHVRNVQAIIRSHHLKSRYDRLRERGFLTPQEAAKAYGVSVFTICHWWQDRRVGGQIYNDNNAVLYEPPSTVFKEG